MTREEAWRRAKGYLYDALSGEEADEIINTLEQESCEDEYIKVPKKALKYRTAGMVAYNAEWLKNHFDIERAVICGEQEPCEDCISRQTVKEQMIKYGFHAPDMTVTEFVEDLPPINPQPCEDAISRQAAIGALREAENHAFNSYYQGLKKAHKIIANLPPVTQDCNTCEVGNPCLYCKHEFEPKVPDINDGKMPEIPTDSESEVNK